MPVRLRSGLPNNIMALEKKKPEKDKKEKDKILEDVKDSPKLSPELKAKLQEAYDEKDEHTQGLLLESIFTDQLSGKLNSKFVLRILELLKKEIN